MRQHTQAELAGLRQQLRAAERLSAIRRARDDLLTYAKLLMPDPNDPDDSNKSRYVDTKLHIALAQALVEVESGKYPRLIINVPPRHGKSQLTSRIFPSWFVGRDPYRSVIVGSYNENLAKDYGRAVRGYMLSQTYRQVFENVHLKKGAAAVDLLETENDGMLAFVGRGGTITGRGGDLIIIDDPLKGTEEANSAAIREGLWTWFVNDVLSRFMSDAASILLIQTRWHEDDLVGRLTDPTNPHYNEEEAASWKIINIPAIAEEDDPLKREVGEALWPERFGLPYLKAQRRRDPVGFSALYQQRPTPADGDFFERSMLKTFKRRDEIPPGLRVYACSDHAVGEKRTADKTCMLIVGVDDIDRIWLLDCVWGRFDTLQQVDKMIALMEKWEPMTWWAERAHIEKAIGPFLKKRMREKEIYVHIQELMTYSDKRAKAAAIQGRMAMGMVMFPEYETWYADARDEMLKFDHGRHDDFVDALSGIGRGLGKMLKGRAPVSTKSKGPRVGSFGWVKQQSAREDRKFSRAEIAEG